MLEIRSHPATVEFKEIHCCDLKSAFRNPAHQEFIGAFIREANMKEPKHSWAILTEIFTNTTRIVFIPGEIHRDFYHEIASLERKLLIENGKPMNCGHHAVKEHIDALADIILLTVYPGLKN